MKYFFWGLALLLIVGCYTERRAHSQVERARNNFPEMFRSVLKSDTLLRFDTFRMVHLGFGNDTLFFLPASDNEVIEWKDSLIYIYLNRTVKDTVVEYKVEYILYPDTIEISVIDTLIQEKIIETVIPGRKGFPWRFFGFIVGIAMLFLALTLFIRLFK